MKIFEKKNTKGITLIALVITIIVLIILAGVTINLTLGENGIFNKAKYAKEEYLNATSLEQRLYGNGQKKHHFMEETQLHNIESFVVVVSIIRCQLIKYVSETAIILLAIHTTVSVSVSYFI